MLLTPKTLPLLALTVNTKQRTLLCHVRGHAAACLLLSADEQAGVVELIRVRDCKRKRFSIERVELDQALGETEAETR